MNIMEEEEVDKKLKMDVVPEIDSQIEEGVEDFETGPINDLPPEMLKEILKNVDTQNLLICRLVNRKWNEFASEILRSRIDAEVQIDIYNAKKKTSLKEFIKCFNDSKDFPYSRFCRHQVKKSTFDDEDWIKFLSDFEGSIKCLKLEINPKSDSRRLIKLIKKLKNLLLNRLPFLEEFGISFDYQGTPIATEIQLFPNPETSTEQTKIQLPHLKVLHLNDHSFQKCTGIIIDLLQASINLQKIESFQNRRYYGMVTDFLFLQSQGKLQYLQAAEIELTAELLRKIKEKAVAPSEFKLKALELDLESLYESKRRWSAAAVFISEVFESSKDTLAELTTFPLGFLKNLQLPKFSKLTSLRIEEEEWIADKETYSISMFPPGLKPLDVFPVLRSLVVQTPWKFDFIHADCIGTPCFPNLTTLNFDGHRIDGQTIFQLSLMCPNVKHLVIADEDEPLDNFPQVGTAIWTHMKKLESLELRINVGSKANAFPAIDSCITGISREDCQRLYDLKKAETNLKKWGSSLKVPKSELKAERKNVSILDLKDLRSLSIELILRYTPGDAEVRDFTKKALTFISEDYALKLMDNLSYKIRREVIKI